MPTSNELSLEVTSEPVNPIANTEDSDVGDSTHSKISNTSSQALEPSTCRRSKRKANVAISAARNTDDQDDAGLDVEALLNEPAWGESDEDYEPTKKRQKQGAQKEIEKKASLIVTLKVSPTTAPAAKKSSTTRRISPSIADYLVAVPKSRATRKPKGEAEEVEDERPMPWGHPQTRAELADSLPYFNCYQGAAATVQGKVKGMLLDDDRFERAYMDEEIVIARAGGGSEIDEATNKSIPRKNLDIDPSRISAFRNHMQKGIPIQLIVGSKNKQCPSLVPFRYCVMGTFYITSIWTEKSTGHIIYKFRMQKRDLERKSWWSAEDSPSVRKSNKAEKVTAYEKRCEACKEISKQVYMSGWMCLNAQCTSFWKLRGVTPTEEELAFSERFLAERIEKLDVEPPFPTVPKLVKYDVQANQDVTSAYKKHCWKGIACPNCGRCNQRIYWACWKCPALGCGFIHAPPLPHVPPTALMGDLEHPYDGHALSDDTWHEKLVAYRMTTHGLYKIHDYKLGHDGIKITHIHANGPINASVGGADETFRKLQEVDIGLQRLPLKNAAVSGLVTAHFSKNFGLPYNYVVQHPELSTSFKDAPEYITNAIRRLTWAGKRAVNQNEDMIINECLAVGYFEDGQMGYHDDGEDSLGPHVVTWSLGCPAIMKIRMKYKYYSGFGKNKQYHPEFPVLPGCWMPEERHKLNNLAKLLSPEKLSEQARKVLNFMKIPRNCPSLLDLKLRHGDFMSMHGAMMQKYYEHEVKPLGELRFSLTGRYVIPEKVPEDQRSMGDLDLDPSKAYDGDLQVYEDWKKEQISIRDQAALRRPTGTSSSPSASQTSQHTI
ncbi:hypothetical protein ACLMJK_003058 [Lecanora helva]